MPALRFAAALAAALLLVSDAAGAAAARTVLFIGNSFLYGGGSAVHFYRAGSVTDLNDEGVGGVPALVASFARQAGLDYDVALETRGGSGLDYHVKETAGVIGSRAWDAVVMHGHSLLDAAKPRDPAALAAGSTAMAALLREKNPAVEIYLMATFPRADQVYQAKGAWAGTSIATMAKDVRAGYDAAARAAKVPTVIPVGEAFARAIERGVADANPYDGIAAGQLGLWTYDHYHASTYGYYLEALVIFGTLSGRDPRGLGGAECSAFELGLSADEARRLQDVAYAQLAAERIRLSSPAPASSSRPSRCR
jgi:hypothetical protein